MFFMFFIFNVFLSFSLHCFLLFAFCFENIHTQNYKYDALHFGKLR